MMGLSYRKRPVLGAALPCPLTEKKSFEDIARRQTFARWEEHHQEPNLPAP